MGRHTHYLQQYFSGWQKGRTTSEAEANDRRKQHNINRAPKGLCAVESSRLSRVRRRYSKYTGGGSNVYIVYFRYKTAPRARKDYPARNKIRHFAATMAPGVREADTTPIRRENGTKPRPIQPIGKWAHGPLPRWRGKLGQRRRSERERVRCRLCQCKWAILI